VQVWGTPDEMKQLHREPRFEMSVYCTSLDTPAEAGGFLDWFSWNT
jgi:hypothetical protein